VQRILAAVEEEGAAEAGAPGLNARAGLPEGSLCAAVREQLGKPALSLVDQAWYADTFIPVVQQRGAAIIKARGQSSAASAASAAIDHIRDWALGSPAGDWVSMGVPSDGSYGIPEGVIYGFPVTCSGGKYQIVQGLAINDFSRARMDATHKELLEERDGVKDLI